ncbi:MAG: ATP-dependent 6-phosphofructokinase [Bacteroidaceae bacterium]
MRIGILSSGGDCPGINATIRGVAKTAINYYGFEVYGFYSGFQGILDKKYINFSDSLLTGLLNSGGTVLGTSRIKPFKKKDTSSYENMPETMEKNLKELKIDCLVCIGGNGTQKTAAKIAAMGIQVISLPKTIDNDIWGTDLTFGFDSAVTIATDAIDRLHSTASSHNRAMVIEVMGHKAGWLALYSGMAAGGDVILIPEIEYDINRVCKTIIKRSQQGKKYSIVVVAEGIKTPNNLRAGEYISKQIEKHTDIETRETVLGYVQRGGSPTAFDRNLATRMGAYATSLIAKGKTGRMVALKGQDIKSVLLTEVAGKLKLVTEDCDLVKEGRKMGICFG